MWFGDAATGEDLWWLPLQQQFLQWCKIKCKHISAFPPAWSPLFLLSWLRTHARTHTYAHTRTHTHARTRTCTCTHTHTHTHTHTRTHTHVDMYIKFYKHTIDMGTWSSLSTSYCGQLTGMSLSISQNVCQPVNFSPTIVSWIFPSHHWHLAFHSMFPTKRQFFKKKRRGSKMRYRRRNSTGGRHTQQANDKNFVAPYALSASFDLLQLTFKA